MRVVPFMPYALDLNLGRAYNESLDLLGDEDWAIFCDHDMMPTTKVWYRQFVEAIAFVPEAGALVAMANRIAPPWQRLDCRGCQFADRRREKFAPKRPGRAPRPQALLPCELCHNIAYQRQIGEERCAVRTLLDITDTQGWGGVFFAVSKRAWREAGGFADGLLCVDHSLHFGLQKTGRRSYLLEHVYAYHWRRAFGDHLPPETPVAPNCPCLGPETAPTVRLTLPCV